MASPVFSLPTFPPAIPAPSPTFITMERGQQQYVFQNLVATNTPAASVIGLGGLVAPVGSTVYGIPHSTPYESGDMNVGIQIDAFGSANLQQISGAVITNATTFTVDFPNTLGFTTGANGLVIAGVTTVGFTGLNGTWTAATVTSNTSVTVTTATGLTAKGQAVCNGTAQSLASAPAAVVSLYASLDGVNFYGVNPKGGSTIQASGTYGVFWLGSLTSDTYAAIRNPRYLTAACTTYGGLGNGLDSITCSFYI